MIRPHAQYIVEFTQAFDVLYFGSTAVACRALLHSIARLELDGVKITRKPGHELVEFPNGRRIHFATVRSLDRARGLSVGLIVTDSHTNLDSAHIRETLRPCFQQAPGVSVEWYSVIV